MPRCCACLTTGSKAAGRPPSSATDPNRIRRSSWRERATRGRRGESFRRHLNAGYRYWVLTVHLTALDLSRTVVRSTPSVMTELTSAGARLMTDVGQDNLVAWTARTGAALRPVMRPFLDLCRVPRWRPDFLTPASNGSDIEAELEQVLATPASRLQAELGPRLDAGELVPRVGALASGDAAAIDQLRAAIVAFHAVAIAPYWTEIVAAVQADRAARGTTIVEEGVEQALRSLSPSLRWESSVLSYQCPGGDDIDINPFGRGLMLVPSYLKHQPSFMDRADAPIVITYPIERPLSEPTTRRPLADLLGRTRAGILRAVDGGRNTTELATTVGTSIASASQHAAVLRAAGLITTHRTGPGVRHTLTPLGRSLLTASQDQPAVLKQA
ncbi:MAG: ArsR/SmtB family transcription factor [Kribbellaceae bacterium]